MFTDQMLKNYKTELIPANADYAKQTCQEKSEYQYF